MPQPDDDGIIVHDDDEPDAMFICQNENCLGYICKDEEVVEQDNGDFVHRGCHAGGYEE